MGRFRRVAALMAVMVCAGCAAGPKLDLSPGDIGGMRLTAVKVAFPANARIEWPEAGTLETVERQVPHGATAPADRAAYRSFAERRLATALSAETHKAVGPLMQGAHPVRLEIQVHELQIPTAQDRTAQVVASTAATTLIAGALVGSVVMVSAPGIFITGDVALVDQASGRELAGAQDLKASSPAFQASGEPVDSIAGALAAKIKGWLTQPSAI